MRAVCRLVLRLSGVLVFVAGILHLWMTDHVVQLLASMEPGETSDVARAAMQLNHLVVGILLLPLGVSLAVIARPLARREPWARTIGLASGLALLALPIVTLLTTRARMLEGVEIGHDVGQFRHDDSYGPSHAPRDRLKDRDRQCIAFRKPSVCCCRRWR